jgi:hypothetical protein
MLLYNYKNFSSIWYPNTITMPNFNFVIYIQKNNTKFTILQLYLYAFGGASLQALYKNIVYQHLLDVHARCWIVAHRAKLSSGGYFFQAIGPWYDKHYNQEPLLSSLHDPLV